MIDIESKVFDTVANAVISIYPTAFCSSEYIEAPSSFPCVTIVEEDNYTYQRTQDESLTEHHANLSYAINIFSNVELKKKQAKSIADIIDNEMQNMKFTRVMRSQIPNADRSIYRIVMRYTGVVSEGKTIGNDTVHQMYRR